MIQSYFRAVVYFDQRLGARTPFAGWNSHFQHFCCKKTKKSKKFVSNFSKKQVFLSLHQNAGQLFYSQKTHQCTDPCTAQLAHYPRPQSDPSWRISVRTTLYCCYLVVNIFVSPFYVVLSAFFVLVTCDRH